jgi:hypothetical protein
MANAFGIYIEVAEHRNAERQLHRLLREHRERKEFFWLTISEAVAVVRKVAGQFPIVDTGRRLLAE